MALWMLADLLTLFRAMMALALMWVGIMGLPMTVAVQLLILGWLSDLLDGPLARHLGKPDPGWLGEHDGLFDLSLSVGGALYLIFSGRVPTVAGWVFLGVLLAVWFLHSPELAWPLYATPYFVLYLHAQREVPWMGYALLAYVAFTFLVRRERLFRQYLPAFFRTVRGLWHSR